MTDNVIQGDFGKQSLRVLKKMRHWHRKNRQDPLHRDMIKVIDSFIEKKQVQYHKKSQALFEKLLKGFVNKKGS